MICGSAVMRLLSAHVGPIRSLRELATSPDQARLPAFLAESADLSHIHGGRVGRISGSAVHYSREAAAAAAVGEAIERYCGAALPHGLALSTAADLGAAAVSPGRFVLFHPAQYACRGFPYHPFLDSTPVRWVRGIELSGRAPAVLPAQLVYLGGDGAGSPGETSIGYATSSGMACAATPDEAVLRGLLEVVERDAVMLTWYLRRSPRRLRWRDDSGLAAVETRCFAPTGLHYVCLDLSDYLQVPTVLALVMGPDVGLAVGAASALNPREAWLQAMREAFATYAWADQLQQTSPPVDVSRLEHVKQLADHVRLYAAPEHRLRASFLLDNQESRDVADLPLIAEPTRGQQIAALCRKIRAAGASAYAVELTTEDVRRAGLHVWKAVSPELQPLDVGYDRRFLGGTRLAAVAREDGRTIFGPDDLNPWPHPFP